MKKQFLEIGEIVGTHAISGELRVYPWCDSPDFLTRFKKLYFDKGAELIKLVSCKVQKNVVIIKIVGIDTIEDAQKLRKKILYIDRNDVSLDDGIYFVQDLIGSSVYDADTGKLYGILSEITQTGASDIYHIKNEDKYYMIPAVPEFIISTDIDSQKIEIRPIAGMFDESGEF